MQNVVLRSAARLEQDQEFEIAKQMQEATQSKNIKIKPVVDEDLMGGFIVEWGDNQVCSTKPSRLPASPLHLPYYTLGSLGVITECPILCRTCW